MKDLMRPGVSHAEEGESGPRSPLNDLSPEIRLLIFEQVCFVTTACSNKLTNHHDSFTGIVVEY
jgi:hypothetical protein